MMNGFSLEQISKLLDEYDNLRNKYGGYKEIELSFMDFVILRTGIGIEKKIKEFSMKERIEDIDNDFK